MSFVCSSGSQTFDSVTICGSRTVTTYQLVPGKLNLPKNIRSKVWKTKINTKATGTKWMREIITAIFKNQQGTQKFKSL